MLLSLAVAVIPSTGGAALTSRLLAHLSEVAAGRRGVAILIGAKKLPAADVLACLRNVADAALLDTR
jgi:hypothetical protein